MIRIFTSLPGGTRAGWRAQRLAFVLAVLALALVAQSGWAQGTAQSNPPLIAAAIACQSTTVSSLLAEGANVNAKAADGRTALIAAAQSDCIAVVRILITAGANLNAATRGTGTALEVAENKGETDISALLLASGARSSGKSVGDTVCVLPWAGDGFCGTVTSFSVKAVAIQVTKIVGCANGCSAKQECTVSQTVGGAGGLQAGSQITVPSWCLSKTGVKP